MTGGPADLRLVGFALGMWGASLVALRVSARAGVGLAVAAALVAGAALLVHRWFAAQRQSGAHAHVGGSDGRRVRTAALVLAGVGMVLGAVCGLLSTAARTTARDAEPLAGLARSRAAVQAELTVTDDPHPLAGGGPGPPTYLVQATLTRLDVEADGTVVRLDARVLVFATAAQWRDLLPGQRVSTAATLGTSRGGDLTAAVLTATGPLTTVDSPSWTQRAAGRLRAGLQAACRQLPPAPGGLLPGLVIGDTSRLDPALDDQFRTTGLTHLVAVSGANVAILLGVVLFAARWCRAGPWLSAAVCAIALAGFVILARPSPSVIRAAAMGSIGLLALATGRSRAAMPALAAAVVVGLLIDPALAVDAGFALSVLATGALVLLAPAWSAGLADRGVPRGLAEALAVPAAAQVVCGPVIVALSGQVSLVAVPANLLAAPAVAPATVLGVAAALISPLWSDGASMLAWLASWPARWLVAIATTGASVPDGTIPWPGGVWGGLGLAGLTVGLLVAGRRRVARRLLIAGALAVAIGAVPVHLLASGWPPANAVIVACAVGQGDALVLPDGPNDAVVIDAGPEPAAVATCLHRLGVRTVAALIFTHFHADHVGGVTGVLDGHQVGAVVLPAFHEPDTGYQAVLDAAAQHRVAITAATVGWTLRRGGLELRAIGPTRALTGTRSDPNNNSLVLRATSHGVSVLLEGDAETEEQGELLTDTDRADLRADVLKVAHHGSAYQDSALLDVVHPAVALVSVGADNPYGHPNAGLLASLIRGGVRVLRTDQDGDIAVVATDHGMAVVRSRSPPDAAAYSNSQTLRPRLDCHRHRVEANETRICGGRPATLQAPIEPWAIRGRRASMAAWPDPERRASSSAMRSCWSHAGLQPLL